MKLKFFNDWYRKFLEQENGMNNEIKQAKNFKDEKLKQTRKEKKQLKIMKFNKEINLKLIKKN